MDMPAGGSIAQISMHNKFQELLAMTDLDQNQDSSLFLFSFFTLYTNSLKQATITTGLSQIILLFHYDIYAFQVLNCRRPIFDSQMFRLTKNCEEGLVFSVSVLLGNCQFSTGKWCSMMWLDSTFPCIFVSENAFSEILFLFLYFQYCMNIKHYTLYFCACLLTE